MKSRGGMDPIKETRDKNHPDRVRVQKPVKPEVGDEVKQMIRSVMKGDVLEVNYSHLFLFILCLYYNVSDGNRRSDSYSVGRSIANGKEMKKCL